MVPFPHVGDGATQFVVESMVVQLSLHKRLPVQPVPFSLAQVLSAKSLPSQTSEPFFTSSPHL